MSGIIGGGLNYWPTSGRIDNFASAFDDKPARFVSAHERKMISALIAEARDVKEAMSGRNPEGVIVRGDALQGLVYAVTQLEGWLILDGELPKPETPAEGDRN